MECILGLDTLDPYISAHVCLLSGDWEIEYITGHPFICHVTDSSDIAVYGMQDGTVCAHPEMIGERCQLL